MFTASKNPIEVVLHEDWKSIRDDFRRVKGVANCVRFATRAGLLTSEQEELWLFRLETTCPGHDDEGGRDWCAYGCDMKVIAGLSNP
jgi:hypothetical protein